MENRMKLRTLAVGLMVGALALTACGQEGSPGGGAPVVTQDAAAGVELTGSKTFDAMKARGRVVMGIREDQPGLGFKDATTNEYSGFDIEIARLVAAQLGFGLDKIDYKPVPSAAREDTIERGEIDYMVGTYTINDNRKQRVSFAGPYYMAGQSLLVRADETAITGKDTLKGKKVCSVTGSTPIQRVRDQGLTEPENIVEFQIYSQCVDQLLNNQVDAVTTDDAILAGYASQQPDKLKLVGEPFSQEPYGIGLAKDDTVLRNKINDILQAAEDDGTWKKIYDETLGKSGATSTAPPIDRY
jgi:glutamate transport system substrate-binding protein